MTEHHTSQTNLASRNNTRLLTLISSLALYGMLSIFTLFFIYCICGRLFYPFEIEWLEGELLCHIIRVIEGKPVFAPPAAEFISEVYPPVYYLVTAAFCTVFSVNFFTPRLVSLLACLGVLYMLYRIALQDHKRREIGFICCGLFLSFYNIHGSWYDLGRVDMLFYCLLLGACYLAAYAKNSATPLLASGLLLTLACFTKQSALIYIPFIVLYLFIFNKKEGLLYGVYVAILLAGLFLYFNITSDGWFAKYTLLNPLNYSGEATSSTLNLHNDFMKDMQKKLLCEVRFEICNQLPIFFSLIVGYLILRFISMKRFTDLNMWECTAIPAALSYFMLRPHVGSEKNDLMYMTLWGTILIGNLLGNLSCLTKSNNAKIKTTIFALLTLQLLLQLYNPTTLVPSRDSEKKGLAFIKMVKDIDGDVYIPHHPMYAIMAGKEMLISAGAYWGYLVTSGEDLRLEDLIDKINRRQFAAIILDKTSYYTMLGQTHSLDIVDMLFSAGDHVTQAIKENYLPAENITYGSLHEFRNLTGFMTRPEIIFRPRTPN